MSENIQNEAISARQVELAINQLDCLSILPCIAAQYIPKLIKGQFHPSIIADIIESDPALMTRILYLISSCDMSMPDRRFSIRNMIEKIPLQEVRDAILSIKISPVIDCESTAKVTDRKSLLMHSLAVACYAGAIAEITSPKMDAQLTYCAGLLHDIGKFALIDTMPRSFYRIIEQAESEKKGCRIVEQQHLRMDHTMIGKRLAEKWQLPDLITLSIWLHHSLNMTVLQDIPEARIAAVVQLADSLARQAQIGISGSFDLPEPTENLAEGLEIDTEQIEQLHQKVRLKVDQKTVILGLDISDSIQRYCDAIQVAAVHYARRDTELSEENRQLQSASSHLNFIRDFLLSIKSNTSVIDIAENFAVRWQKFYQTGRVCLFFSPPVGTQILEAIVVENFSQSEAIVLNAPVESTVIPESIKRDFAILDAEDNIDWLLEQLGAEFDVNRTKLVPVISGTKAIGVIAFELNYPSDIRLFEDKFRTSASIVGVILGIALGLRKERYFAERFAQFINITPKIKYKKPEATQSSEDSEELSMEYSLNALAELAAGAAHELNNPLAVISGRAQLLAEAEQNKEKKQILEQIQENANEASEIIEDLMSFAEPPLPRPTETDISQIIDEAIQLATRKTNIEQNNIKIEKTDDIKSLFIDSAQIVSAIANILCNAVESYGQDTGSIKITAQLDESTDFVKLSIEDNGCGMDTETLKKATQPFFSARPAGRKRGMGLAYASRLIQLNKGSLSIISEPGHGTTVSIYLPLK